MMMSLSAYLDRGFYLFPLKPRDKAPLTPQGFKNASNELPQIEKWGRLYEGCNWGVATGASDLLVVDVDIHKGGSLVELEKAIGMELPDTLQARTGGGGIHLVFKRNGLSIPTKLGLLKGIDILSNTGYIVAAPSIHPSGAAYEWVSDPAVTVIADAPAALVAYLAKQESSKSFKRVNPGEDGPSEELFLRGGNGRWDKLRTFAGRMRNWGWGYDAILGSLSAFAESQMERDETVSDKKIAELVRFICNKPVGEGLTSEHFSPPVMVKIELNGEVQEIDKRNLRAALIKGARLL